MKWYGFMLLIGALLFAPVGSQGVLAQEIVINIPAKELSLVDNGQVLKKYPVAVGKANTQTPVGNFKVVEKIVNPVWIDPDDLDNKIASGPSNPLGYRWIGIGGHYGIHGTIHPNSIGTYASNGCIRMHEKDVEDLFSRIKVGTKVNIKYDTMPLLQKQDGTIGFMVYSDGYHKKAVTSYNLLQEVKAKYPEIKDFVDANKLFNLIKVAGYGHFQGIIRVVKVRDNGNKHHFSAYEYNYVMYLPLAEVAQVARTYYTVKNNVATTKLGSAELKVFGNRYYIPLTSIRQIFPLYYGFENRDIILEPVWSNANGVSNNDLEQYPVDVQPVGHGEKFIITKSKQAMDKHVKRLKGEK